jgi:hypothetical protein
LQFLILSDKKIPTMVPTAVAVVRLSPDIIQTSIPLLFSALIVANASCRRAVGTMVGIPEENIIASVLPGQKADKIQYLQRTLKKVSSRIATPTSAIVMAGESFIPSPTMAIVALLSVYSSVLPKAFRCRSCDWFWFRHCHLLR